MAEYIERETLLECAEYDNNYRLIIPAEAIKAAPAADAVPVVHSYWEHKITSGGENIGICHNCKYPVSWFLEIAKFCPNCGCRMDGEFKDEIEVR